MADFGPLFTKMSNYTSRQLTCPTHGVVDDVILFNEDIVNAYCCRCWKDDLVKNPAVRKTVLSN